MNSEVRNVCSQKKITLYSCFTRAYIEQVEDAKCMLLTVNMDLDRDVNVNLSFGSRSGSESEGGCESDS